MDFKLQTGRALSVVPSDTIDIPVPSSKVASGAQTSATANKLTDSGATFNDGSILVGDVVHDTTGGSIATVTAIDSATVLSISADIFTATENYVIYRRTTKDCVIYVGVTGDVTVETAGGDSVTLKAVPAGMIIPLNVKRVDSTNTTATDMVAMW
jgi:hypothetical protein